MKAQKIKRIRRSVSRYFPKGHPKEGQPTYFVEKILNSLYFAGKVTLEEIKNLNIKDFDWKVFETCFPKLHTCRAALDSWIKIVRKVNSGEYVLELFYWSGKPYHKDENGIGQVVFATLDKDSGCGVQELNFIAYNIERPCIFGNGYAATNHISTLAKNDGLSLDDFKAWFKGYDLSQPMAIIQFTKFRY